MSSLCASYIRNYLRNRIRLLSCLTWMWLTTTYSWPDLVLYFTLNSSRNALREQFQRQQHSRLVLILLYFISSQLYWIFQSPVTFTRRIRRGAPDATGILRLSFSNCTFLRKRLLPEMNNEYGVLYVFLTFKSHLPLVVRIYSSSKCMMFDNLIYWCSTCLLI
jgi:hypothetical protein